MLKDLRLPAIAILSMMTAIYSMFATLGMIFDGFSGAEYPFVLFFVLIIVGFSLFHLDNKYNFA